jgi:hypothetical protein
MITHSRDCPLFELKRKAPVNMHGKAASPLQAAPACKFQQ